MIKSKALNLTVSTALLLSMAAVAGCGNANDGNTTRTNNVDGGRIGVNSVRNNQNVGSTQQHDLSNLKYSKALSKSFGYQRRRNGPCIRYEPQCLCFAV